MTGHDAYGLVAQWIEHRSSEPSVGGSNLSEATPALQTQGFVISGELPLSEQGFDQPVTYAICFPPQFCFSATCQLCDTAISAAFHKGGYFHV